LLRAAGYNPATMSGTHHGTDDTLTSLSVEQTALLLKVSPVTVRRERSSATIWLYRELAGLTANGPGSLETAR
jgi:hypothetical protein